MDSIEVMAQDTLRHLKPAQRAALQSRVLGAFKAWESTRISQRPSGLRAGVDTRGDEYFETSALIMPFLSSGDASLDNPPLSAYDIGQVAAALVTSLGSPGDTEGLARLMTSASRRRHRQDGAAKMAAAVRPAILQNQKMAAGRAKGARAPKARKPLQTYIDSLVKECPKSSAEEIWRKLKRHTSNCPYEKDDSEIYVDDDKIVVASNGKEHGIKRASLDRYVTKARRR